MGVLDGYDANRLQFVADALRTINSAISVDLTKESDRKKIGTPIDILGNGHIAIRNSDGTSMTLAQIATAANLTVAQVTDLAKRL